MGGTTWYSMATTWNKNYTALLRKGYIFAADFYIFKFNSKDKKMKRFEKMMLLGLMVASSPVVSMDAMPAAFAITGQTNLAPGWKELVLEFTAISSESAK